MNEPVLRCRVLAINPHGNVTFELKAMGVPPVILVTGVGGGFQFNANLIEPQVSDVEAAKAALAKFLRASPPEAAPPPGAPRP